MNDSYDKWLKAVAELWLAKVNSYPSFLGSQRSRMAFDNGETPEEFVAIVLSDEGYSLYL